jgi:hypothetical protein
MRWRGGDYGVWVDDEFYLDPVTIERVHRVAAIKARVARRGGMAQAEEGDVKRRDDGNR